MSTPLGLVLGFWMGGGNRRVAPGQGFLRAAGSSTASFLANTPGVLSADGTSSASFVGQAFIPGGATTTFYILGF